MEILILATLLFEPLYGQNNTYIKYSNLKIEKLKYINRAIPIKNIYSFL